MQVRPFTDDDFGAFVEFARRHLGPSHSTDRRFNEHWFKDRKTGGWNALVAEDENGALAGAFMLIVVPAKLGHAKRPLAWISSTAVTDELKSRGAGARFYVSVYRRYPIVGAMSGNEDSIPLNAMLGREIPGIAMRRFICVHDHKTAELCLPERRVRVLQVACEKGIRTHVTLRWTDVVPGDYDALWAEFRGSVYCTVEKDSDFLLWRYAEAPFVAYRFLEMRDSERLCGLAVIRFQPTPAGTAARVLDFVSDVEHAAESWAALARACREEGAIFTDFMIVGTRYDVDLARARFLPADDTTGLNAVPHLLSPVEHREWTNTFHLGGSLAKADSGWQRPDGVYFTKGDSDRDWPTDYNLRSQGS